MAKGRKSKYIKQVKSTEQNALKCLWRTGIATKSQLEKHFDLHGQRLTKFEQSGFISIQQDIIRLDKKGIEYCKKELSLEFRYITTSKHLKHDLKLTEGYLRLPEDIRETWKTESQLYYEAKENPNFEDFKKEIESQPNQEFKAVPDAAIIDPHTGSYMGFECVTENYNQSDINQKEAFCNTYLGGIYKF